MAYPPVPYISQIDGAPRRNDCGLASVLMLARWIDPDQPATVTSLSQQFDSAQDGTTTANLASALRYMGLTPTIGSAAAYPYIESVSYPRLPKRHDLSFTGLHWIVRLDDTHYHDPYWPGTVGANIETTKAILDAAETSVAQRVGIVERPEDTMAPPVSTIIRPPYGKTYHVCIGGTVAQRKAVYALAVDLGHSATCSADDGALSLLQVTPSGVSEFSQRTIYFYGVAAADQAAYRAFVAGAYPSTVAPVIEFRAWPGEAKPAITFTANPASIASGASSTLSWTGSNILGAYRSDDGSTWRGVVCPSSEAVRPTATRTYYFRVQDMDTTYRQLTAVVTVTSAPPIPPPPSGVIRHGCHVRTDATAARTAASLGNQCTQIMDHFDVARELAAANPNAIVMHRKWSGLENYKLNGAQLAALMEPCGGKVWITLLNECDQYAYGSAAEIRARAQVEIDAARILLARGDKVLLGGFSMGTPNWLDPAICQAFRETYAAFLNSDVTGRVGLNFHLYSPYPGHMQGQVRRDAILSDGLLTPFDAGTWYTFDPAYPGCAVAHIPAIDKSGNEYIITRLIAADSERAFAPSLSRSIDLGDDRIWYEGRWRFAYDPAYGAVKPSIPVFSDEWGLDEGGVGGGPAHGWQQSDWLAWCGACTEYQRQPLLVGGVSYPSPLRGGTVFQCSSASGWEGYYVPPGVFAPIWAAGQG